MALLTWTAEQFATNVTAADDEHKVIFDLANALNDAVSGGNRADVGARLDALIGYVAAHFKTEEDLFDKHGYPDAVAHKAKHAELVNTCLDVQRSSTPAKSKSPAIPASSSRTGSTTIFPMSTSITALF
jgi:hemerythrin